MANTVGSNNNHSGGKFKHQNFTTYQSYLSSSGSSSSIPDYKFDVFISFRGEDTRNGFTDHLHAELNRNKINTFKDDEELDRGKGISPELLKAIVDSRFSIVVLSENYAASRWCMDELVHILECLKPGKTIFPIFYHVDPAVVRHQTNSYEKAFSEHEVNYKNQVDKVKRWRFALTAVADLSGWHLNHGCEAEFIQKIVEDVSSKLADTSKVLDKLDNVYDDLLRKLKGTSEGFSDGEINIHHKLRLTRNGDGEINHHKLRLTRLGSHHQKQYDVFINFKVDDMATSFTDHLYTALGDKGITYFNDDEDGKEHVSPKRMQAIKDSRLLLIVLSRNYAASTLCLDELVHILECSKYRSKVFPIYYDVIPTLVRFQTDIYGEAFANHEENNKHQIENVQTWRSALVQVANITGFLKINNRHEQELIAEIVHVISGKLKILDKCGTLEDVSHEISYENLVGIDSRLKKLFVCLDTNSNHTRIIGILGMAGIGKTTIAKAIYNKISGQFEVCCFLANVREDSQRLGLVALQKKLVARLPGKVGIIISNEHQGSRVIKQFFRSKRVLIVLDDADHLDQIEALVGNGDWFGVGSRILITTRGALLLKLKGVVDATYTCEGLNYDESMQLLCLTAFEQNNPMDGYEMVCNCVIKIANGNPSVLRRIGSSLPGRSINEWIHFLESTRNEETVQKELRLSYDSFDEVSKDIFLHVACFFNGKKADRVMQVLECCGLYSRIGMAILIENSLVTISNNILLMPDSVQEMGKEIVRRECISDPGKRSRLWHHEDIINAMTRNSILVNKLSWLWHHLDIVNAITRNSETDAIRAIVLDDPKLEVDWNREAFSSFHNLILLSIRSKVRLPLGLEDLPNNLRFFKWRGYPLRYFPPNFYPSQLVELNMCHGNIELLWRGTEFFWNLKTIKLSYSQNLVKSPNFTGVPNLERLVLEGCKNLAEIHPSIRILKKLRSVNLKDCSSLRSLPNFISTRSLEICILSGCSRLNKVLEVEGHIIYLLQLYLDGTRALHRRKLGNNLASLLPKIPYITKLSLRNCDLPEGAIPSDIGCLTSLEVLDLSRNNFISLPSSISQLVKLKLLGLAHCNLLQSVPELPSNIEYVEARDCSSLITFSNPSEGTTTSTGLVLSFINCYLLKKNQDGKSLIITWLKAYLRSLLNSQKDQVLPHLSGRLDIIVPGTRIVEWFRHHSIGPSIRIHLPPKWNNNNWIGFVFCVVFGVSEQRIDVENSHEITCQLYTNEGLVSNGFGFRISKGTLFDSSHIWVRYISNGSFRERMVKWNRVSYIEASFGMESQCLEVKKCGFHVVYKQDVEETKKRQLQYIFPPIEDLGMDFFSF